MNVCIICAISSGKTQATILSGGTVGQNIVTSYPELSFEKGVPVCQCCQVNYVEKIMLFFYEETMNDIAGHHLWGGGRCVAQDKCEVKNAGFIHTDSFDVRQDAAMSCPLLVQGSVTHCLIIWGNLFCLRYNSAAHTYDLQYYVLL